MKLSMRIQFFYGRSLLGLILSLVSLACASSAAVLVHSSFEDPTSGRVDGGMLGIYGFRPSDIDLDSGQPLLSTNESDGFFEGQGWALSLWMQPGDNPTGALLTACGVFVEIEDYSASQSLQVRAVSSNVTLSASVRVPANSWTQLLLEGSVGGLGMTLFHNSSRQMSVSAMVDDTESVQCGEGMALGRTMEAPGTLTSAATLDAVSVIAGALSTAQSIALRTYVRDVEVIAMTGGSATVSPEWMGGYE